MRKVMLLAFVFLLFTVGAHSQQPETVTISREAAIKCLQDADEVEVLRGENSAQAEAIRDLNEIIEKLKIEIARMSGEKTQLEATLVRYNALIDILVRNSRPKKIGLINLFE